MSVSIIYEDSVLLVVEKPSGMVVHPAYRHAGDTLWDALLPLWAARGIADRPHLLHRLDRATSGLLLVPKLPDAHRKLERALRGGRFEKEYLALVYGRTASDGVVDMPLGRDPANPRRVCPRHDGQPARTAFRTVRRLADHSLLRVTIATGRTHQIRAHLASIGHPLAGDPVYGPPASTFARLFLHADRLAFPHPYDQRIVRCRSPLPLDLRLVVCRLVAACAQTL